MNSARQTGLLWRALQGNPTPGSFTQTCSVSWRYPLYLGETAEEPGPTQLLENAFQHRSMQQHIKKAQESFEERARRRAEEREAEEIEPDSDSGSDSDSDSDSEDFEEIKESLQNAEGTGPDGEGYDTNIKSAEDFKEAVLTICRSWKSIKVLHWDSSGLPFFSEAVKHIAYLSSLEVLTLHPGACDEDFFHVTPPTAGTLHPPRKFYRPEQLLKSMNLTRKNYLVASFPNFTSSNLALGSHSEEPVCLQY